MNLFALAGRRSAFRAIPISIPTLAIPTLAALAFASLTSAPAFAESRDVLDAAAWKAEPDDATKILFVADAGNHGARGHHEFVAGAIMMARTLNAAYPQVRAVVRSSKAWPESFEGADCVVVLLNHAGRAADDPNLARAAEAGAGVVALHYGVEVDKGAQGENYLKWIGGYFEPFWSVNPWWTPKYEKLPDHPIARGVGPFEIRDEWYYHMRFAERGEAIMPILQALPPLETIQGGGKELHKHGGNPHAYAAVERGEPQVTAWAYERPEGKGRGFGFTGLHLHENLGDANFRTVLLNAIAWTAGLEVPEAGVPSPGFGKAELEAAIDEGNAAVAAGK